MMQSWLLLAVTRIFTIWIDNKVTQIGDMVKGNCWKVGSPKEILGHRADKLVKIQSRKASSEWWII